MKLFFEVLLVLLVLATTSTMAVFVFKPGLDGVGRTLDVSGDNYLSQDELPPLMRREKPYLDLDDDQHIGPFEFRIRMVNELLRDKTPFDAPVYEGEYRFSDLTRFIGDSAVAGAMSGAVLMLGYQGEVVYELSFGEIDAQTQVPVASASKWLTAAVMGALADRGVIELERPLGEWAPDGIPESYRDVTIAQMMAHTSGIFSRIGLLSRDSLESEVDAMLAEPLQADPGSSFRYGSASMMVAARIAEIRTGKSWRQLAHETILGPLRMDDTVYANPVRPAEYGLETAPEVASGVHTTAEDYMKFLALLARGGIDPDVGRILKRSTIRKMELAQSIGASRDFVPPAVTHDFEYAMGTWCERWREDGQCLLLHSQGAFGARPFLDRETGVYGIFLILEDGAMQRHIVQRMREVALDTAINELGLKHNRPAETPTKGGS